jgi:DNA-binding GntR family transcriptional regulator
MMPSDEQSSKTEAAYRVLRRDILATRLAPAAPLKLSTLRDTYGIGWTPLREALSRLEAERLVTAISNRGFAVAPVSRAELEDLARARLVVELPLLAESIEKGDRQWEDAVVAAHYRLSRCGSVLEDPSDAAVDAWYETHDAFHAALLGAATSSWLLRFNATISDQLYRHHRFLGMAPILRAAAGRKDGHGKAMDALRDAVAVEHHTALMEAALDRDPEGAKTLMTVHIGYTLQVFAQTEPGGAADAAPLKKKRRSGKA